MHAHRSNLLMPIKQKLDAIEINNDRLAQFLCRAIPASCPFEREIEFFDRLIVRIPPLCKLNPLYEQLVGLRFRAICYLAQD